MQNTMLKNEELGENAEKGERKKGGNLHLKHLKKHLKMHLFGL